MSIVPSDQDLEEAMFALLLSQPTLQGEVAEITTALKEDHFLWKIDPARVAVTAAKLQTRVKKPLVRPAKLFNFDFYQARRMNISPATLNMNTVGIEGLYHAQGGLGSLGVFLIKVVGSGAFVLKERTLKVYDELFAGIFLKKMGFNLTPNSRLLTKEELESLSIKLGNAPIKVANTCSEINEDKFQKAGGVVMEFVQGQELSSMNVIMNRNEYLSVLGQVARLAAIDTAINNVDRTNYLRRGKGNAANIMLEKLSATTTLREVVITPIDNAVQVMKEKRYAESYFQKIANTSLSPDELNKLFKFIKDNTFYEHPALLKSEEDQEGFDTVRQGIVNGFLLVRKEGFKVLEETLSEVRSKFNKEYDSNHEVENFVKSAMEAMATVPLDKLQIKETEEALEAV